MLIRKICGAAQRSKFLSSLRSYAKAAYEGEGKTTVKVLNMDPEYGLMIDSYATFGFRLNNGITVLGPMAIFPKTVLSWQVKGSHDVNEDSLRLFKILEPKIDLVVVGLETNDRGKIDRVFRAARSIGLNVEILGIEHACSTFNFLNAESRCLGGAMIPPLNIAPNENDMLRSKLHYQNLYERPMTA